MERAPFNLYKGSVATAFASPTWRSTDSQGFIARPVQKQKEKFPFGPEHRAGLLGRPKGRPLSGARGGGGPARLPRAARPSLPTPTRRQPQVPRGEASLGQPGSPRGHTPKRVSGQGPPTALPGDSEGPQDPGGWRPPLPRSALASGDVGSPGPSASRAPPAPHRAEGAGPELCSQHLPRPFQVRTRGWQEALADHRPAGPHILRAGPGEDGRAPPTFPSIVPSPARSKRHKLPKGFVQA